MAYPPKLKKKKTRATTLRKELHNQEVKKINKMRSKRTLQQRMYGSMSLSGISSTRKRLKKRKTTVKRKK